MCTSCCCSPSRICARRSTCTPRPGSSACRTATTNTPQDTTCWPSACPCPTAALLTGALPTGALPTGALPSAAPPRANRREPARPPTPNEGQAWKARSGLTRTVAAVISLRLVLRAIPAVPAVPAVHAFLAARFLAPAGLTRHLAEVLVHRAQQEEQRHAHRGHHEEPKDTGHHLAGRGRGQDSHRLTISRMPANRSSSGSSVSTSDLARG